MTNDSCLRRSRPKTATWAEGIVAHPQMIAAQLDKIAADLSAIDGRAKEAGLTVYLMEELGDARLRCEELVRYVAEATKLVEKSTHRDHFFEVAGHLIQGIPEALFKLQKALQAVSLAASRMDYEELKQELKPEKVDELEQVLKDIRIRHVQRRSDPIRPWEQNMIDDLWKTPEARSAKTEDKESRFEEGKPADPTENMSPEDAKKWKVEHDKNKDNFKSAEDYSGKVYVVIVTKDGKRSKEGPFASTNRYQEARELLTSKLADPDVKSVSFERAEKLKEAADDKFAAAVPVDRLKGAVESIERACKDIKHHLGKGDKTPMEDVLSLFNDIRGTSSTMVRRLDKNASEDDPKFATELSMDVAGDFQSAALALKSAARGLGVKKNTCIAIHLVASAVGKLKEPRSADALYRAYDILRASGLWDLSEPAPMEARLGSDDDKRSRFEEGKPADPTENMSPEDAKRWKEEHAKNKDNFKAAATTAPKLAAKLEKLANDLFDFRVEVRKAADDVQDLLEDSSGDILSGAYANERVKEVRNELRTADNAMGDAARGSEYLARVLKGQRKLAAEKEACGCDQQASGDEALYGQIKPGCGVTIMTPHGQQVTGTAIARGPAGWILNVKGRPGIAHPENVLKVAGNDEKESRFEEGKPADPTENMSPEDAKKWKVEHDKNKDNFKAAARIVPLTEAKKGDMVEIPVGVPWPRDSKKEKFTGKVVRVLKDGGMLVNVEKTRDNPGGHPNEDVGYVEIGPPKKTASEDDEDFTYGYGR